MFFPFIFDLLKVSLLLSFYIPKQNVSFYYYTMFLSI